MQEGNLDLESLEELLTSSGPLGPGPLRAFNFRSLNFCVIFRDDVCIVFSFILMGVAYNLGSMLASFSMFVAFLSRASIRHRLAINFARIVMYLMKYMC